MVSCVLLLVNYVVPGRGIVKGQRGFKLASVTTTEGNHGGRHPSANTRSPYWHATQCLICFRTKCKSTQVFWLSGEPQEKRGEGDGKQQNTVDKNGRGKTFYRLVTMIRVCGLGVAWEFLPAISVCVCVVA